MQQPQRKSSGRPAAPYGGRSSADRRTTAATGKERGSGSVDRDNGSPKNWGGGDAGSIPRFGFTFLFQPPHCCLVRPSRASPGCQSWARWTAWADLEVGQKSKIIHWWSDKIPTDRLNKSLKISRYNFGTNNSKLFITLEWVKNSYFEIHLSVRTKYRVKSVIFQAQMPEKCYF